MISAFFIVVIATLCNAKNPVVTQQVYLTVSIDNEEVGKIIIGVFGNIVPKTARNFVELATHKHGYGYRGSSFHRVDRYYYILGGSFKYGNRSEGTSIYGRYFPDENYELKHYGSGWVSMANAGPEKNGSQFFIVTYKLEMMDNKNVVFGKVLRGMSVVRKVQDLETSSGNPPSKPCIITDSGILPTVEPFAVAKDDSPYNDPPSDPSGRSEL